MGIHNMRMIHTYYVYNIEGERDTSLLQGKQNRKLVAYQELLRINVAQKRARLGNPVTTIKHNRCTQRTMQNNSGILETHHVHI